VGSPTTPPCRLPQLYVPAVANGFDRAGWKTSLIVSGPFNVRVQVTPFDLVVRRAEPISKSRIDPC